MSLRRRTLLIVCLLMLATLVAVHWVGQGLVYPSFIALEHEEAQRNSARVVQVINREFALLGPSCEDWSYWDDTYRFVQDGNQEYRDVNLTEASQLSLKVNLMAYYDRDHRRVWSRGMDFASQTSFPLDEFARPELPADHPLLAREDRPLLRYGLLNTSHGPMLAVSAPILRSRRDGPRMGTLVMGRFLDDEAVKRIAQQTLLRIRLSQTKANMRIPFDRLESDLQIPHSPFRFETTDDYTRATTTLADVSGHPLLDLSIDTPREVSARGRNALLLSMKAVAVAGLAIAAILAWLLNTSIVRPIVAITRHAREIGAKGDLDGRLALARKDEIGALASEFDRMLDRLRDSQQRLSQENYRAGANEMAGGVIQDLHRSLEPLREHIDQPLKLLDRAHTASMQMLLQELGAAGTSHHRQTEIVQQLTHQASDLADVLAEARGELRGIRKNLEQLQAVVTEYSRFLRTPNTREPLAIGLLLEQAVRRQPVAQRQALEVELDESVYRAPSVEAAREVLQQVLNVLLAQAAERPAGGQSARLHLRVTASEHAVEGRAMVHLRFEDNRSTADAEAQLALFNRQANHGSDVAGLSLVWAENAVSSMGGRLHAQASPTFEGLTLHLLLPRAKPGEH